MAAWGRKPICCWNPLRVADPSSTSWSLFTPPPAISGPQLWKTFWQWPSVKLLTWKLTNLVMWYYSDLYSQLTSVCVIWVNSRERALIRETWGSVAALRGWQVTTTTSFPHYSFLITPLIYTNTKIHKYKTEQIHKYINTWGSMAALRGWQVTTTAGFPYLLDLYHAPDIHKYTNTRIHKYIDTLGYVALRRSPPQPVFPISYGIRSFFIMLVPKRKIHNIDTEHTQKHLQNTQIGYGRLAGYQSRFSPNTYSHILN